MELFECAKMSQNNLVNTIVIGHSTMGMKGILKMLKALHAERHRVPAAIAPDSHTPRSRDRTLVYGSAHFS